MTLVIFFIVGYLIKRQYTRFTNYSTVFYLVLFVLGEMIAQMVGIQSFASRLYPKIPICFIVSLAITVAFFLIVKIAYKQIRGTIFDHLICFVGRNSLLTLALHTMEFEYILEMWSEIKMFSNIYLDQFVHGIFSIGVNCLLLVILTMIKTQIRIICVERKDRK